MRRLVDELVAAGVALERMGLAAATAGNLSVTDGEVIAISPTGAPLGSLAESGVSLLSRDGTHLSGPAPSKEVPLHLAMLDRIAEARAVVHVHSPAAVAAACRAPWSSESAVPPLTPYFVMRVGKVPLVPYARPGSDDLAAGLRAAPGGFRAALLQSHGPVVAGVDLEHAIDAAAELEATARVWLAVGDDGVLLGEDAIRDLASAFGAAW